MRSFRIGGDEFADAAAQPAAEGVRRGMAVGAILGLLVGGLVYFAGWRYWLIPVVAALVGAYAGSLTGALGRMQPAPQQGGRRRLREAGVMLATRVDASRAPLAARLLGEGGAEDIEQSDGIWRDGQWQDFDPVTAPNVQGRPSPPAPKQRIEFLQTSCSFALTDCLVQGVSRFPLQ